MRKRRKKRRYGTKLEISTILRRLIWRISTISLEFPTVVSEQWATVNFKSRGIWTITWIHTLHDRAHLHQPANFSSWSQVAFLLCVGKLRKISRNSNPNVWCFEFSHVWQQFLGFTQVTDCSPRQLLRTEMLFSEYPGAMCCVLWVLLPLNSASWICTGHCNSISLFLHKTQSDKDQIKERCQKVLITHLPASQQSGWHVNLPSFVYTQIYSSHHKVTKDANTN